MILSRILKRGHCSDGLTGWDQNISTWLVETASESEEFRPFLALTSETDCDPKRDVFNPDENLLIRSASKADSWRPLRPHDLTQPISEEEPAIEVSSEAPVEPDDAEMIEEILPEPTYAEGLEEGFQNGIRQGRLEAETLADERINEFRAEVDPILQGILESRNLTRDDVYEDLGRLSLHIARQIVRGELSVSAEAISQLVHESLEHFSLDEDPKICLNPEDKKILEDLKPDSIQKMILVADPQLSRGSVRIECGERRSEDLLEDRVAEIAEKMFGAVDAVFRVPIEPISVAEKTISGKSSKKPTARSPKQDG
jgi:flagellar biosynthesis/type III secretory pathway protein FliH